MVKENPHQSPYLSGTINNIAMKNRHEPTPAEALLWQLLRGRQVAGAKLRRQHPIDRFIVDFCCPRAHLIIEVDGEIHNQQVEADQEREQALMDLGYRILRFTNDQVLQTPEKVLLKIQQNL